MDLKNQSQSGKTSLEEIENEGIKNVKISLQKLYTIWNDFGIDINQKSNRAKVVWVHVQNLIQDILKEETDFYKKVLKRVENYKIKIQELSTTLSVLPKEITAESLIEEDELLQQELDNLYQLKNKQIKAYQDLKNVELKYCRILNFPEHQLSSGTGIPSKQDIIEIQECVNMLKEEKEKRYKKLCLAKRELISIWESTEYTPETPFEREILSTGQNFSLSDETFQKIEKTINEAEIKKAELEEQKENFDEEINSLMGKIASGRRENRVFKKHQACSASTIKSIQQEIERYEKIKKENIERFIISLQQELHQLWNKCHVAESIRQQFKYYFCSERTDEVLQTYEAEVEKWRNYYEDVEHIFNKINKRDELWSLMLDFEKKAADPNRFKNRKGNLLQEEKQRKKLQKDLPALETNIFKDIEAYEVAKQCPFLYDGEDYRIFVTNQWTERTNQKENYKQEKYKQHLFELGLNPGMSGKLSPSVAPKLTPNKLLKHDSDIVLLHTPATKIQKKMPPNSASKYVGEQKNSNILKSVQLKKQVLKPKKRNQPASTPMKSSPNGTTYNDFAQELDQTKRQCLRSSVLATCKPGGSRTTQCHQNKKKNLRKALRKSRKNISTLTLNSSDEENNLVL